MELPIALIIAYLCGLLIGYLLFSPETPSKQKQIDELREEIKKLTNRP